MAQSWPTLVAELLKSSDDSSTMFAFGLIAVQVMKYAQAIHERKYDVVGIKSAFPKKRHNACIGKARPNRCPIFSTRPSFRIPYDEFPHRVR